MKYVVSSEAMRSCDRYAIRQLGIPSSILMENAAAAATEIIEEITRTLKIARPGFAIFCGSGNNGGDGFAIARRLSHGAQVSVYFWGNPERMTPETRTNYDAVLNHGIDLIHLENEERIAAIALQEDCVIDALLGVGGNEEPRGLLLPLLKKLREYAGIKIAIDVPTGCNADTGRAHTDCFYADYTITMAALKTGMVLRSGPDMCGDIIVAPFGIPAATLQRESHCAILESDDIRSILPRRARTTSKFDYGRVAVLAGSKAMPGAAALCANAAISAGAGLVTLLSCAIHSAARPEIMISELPAHSQGGVALTALDEVMEEIHKCSVVALGPGLGASAETLDLCTKVLEHIPEQTTVIIDADGLRALDAERVLGPNYILTPHIGEFGRLTGIPRATVAEHSFELANEWSQRLNCTIILKHIPSVIAGEGRTFLNVNGNPGMATAGSGDVLTGIVAALAGQGLTPFRAAGLGAFLHAAAGDMYAARFSEETLTATGLTDSLDYVFAQADADG